MRNSSILFIFLAFVTTVANAQGKKVCFTVDDLPVASSSTFINKQEVTEHLVSFFAAHKIPAVGFVVENKLYSEGEIDSSQVSLLEMWLSHGLELGNHTFSHPNYHDVGYAMFTNDILNGQIISKPLSDKYATPYRYLRHPYLKSGKTEAAADSLSLFLVDSGYLEAPVTIDNQDYLFAAKYEAAFEANDDQLMQKIGAEYIRFTKNKIEYYENLSEATFGRQISEVFLMHANKLNADYVAELFHLFVDMGYSITTIDEVLTDNAYSEPVTRYNDWGISWLERWALSKGTGKALFKTDPVVPDYIAN